jgi:SPP1 gp7 family putative phage head morphogenesis protein
MRDFQIAYELSKTPLTQSEARRLYQILQGSNEALARIVARNNPKRPTAITRARARRLRQQIAQAMKTVNGNFDSEFRDYVNSLSEAERDAQVELLERATRARTVGLKVATINKQQLTAAVWGHPFEGDYLANWVAKLHEGDLDRVYRQMQIGFVTGQTTDEIVRAIVGTAELRYKDGVRNVTRRGIRGLVRTTTNHLASIAREEVYFENRDIIDRYQWVSTLDGRTTVICRALDGKVFALGYGPKPPAHYACRSTTVPLLKGFDKLPAGFKRVAKSDEFTGEVPARETYDSWLRKQSEEFQDKVLGKKKGALFRAGMKLDRFVELETGYVYTLKDLEREMPGLWKQAGLEPLPKAPSEPVVPPAPVVPEILRTAVDVDDVTIWRVGEVDGGIYDLVRTYDEHTSPEVKKVLSDANVRIILADSMTSIDPSLKGRRPLGWPEGTTWDDVGGAYNWQANAIVMTNANLNSTPLWSEYTMLHEVGHALDSAGFIDEESGLRAPLSDHPKFREAFLTDLEVMASLPIDEARGKFIAYEYYTQPNGFGEKETFAEAYATLTHPSGEGRVGFFESDFQNTMGFIADWLSKNLASE